MSQIWDGTTIFVTNLGRNVYFRHKLVYFNSKI